MTLTPDTSPLSAIEARVLGTLMEKARTVRRPSDRRLYLISDLDPERIGRQFRWIAAFHATVFLGAAAATAWFGQIGVF